MANITKLELFEAAFLFAAGSPEFAVDDRDEAEAKSEFFALLAKRIRSGQIAELLHAETAACMVLGFLLMGVDEDSLPERLEKLAEKIVHERDLLIDMETFAEGDPDAEPE